MAARNGEGVLRWCGHVICPGLSTCNQVLPLQRSGPSLGIINFEIGPKVRGFGISPRIGSCFADGERIGVIEEVKIVIVRGLIVSSYYRIVAVVGSRQAIRVILLCVSPRGQLSNYIGTVAELGGVKIIVPATNVSVEECRGYQKVLTADCVYVLRASRFP